MIPGCPPPCLDESKVGRIMYQMKRIHPNIPRKQMFNVTFEAFSRKAYNISTKVSKWKIDEDRWIPNDQRADYPHDTHPAFDMKAADSTCCFRRRSRYVGHDLPMISTKSCPNHGHNVGVEPKIVVFQPPKMDDLYISWKSLFKWMIWGYHYFGNTRVEKSCPNHRERWEKSERLIRKTSVTSGKHTCFWANICQVRPSLIGRKAEG